MENVEEDILLGTFNEEFSDDNSFNENIFEDPEGYDQYWPCYRN